MSRDERNETSEIVDAIYDASNDVIKAVSMSAKGDAPPIWIAAISRYGNMQRFVNLGCGTSDVAEIGINHSDGLIWITYKAGADITVKNTTATRRFIWKSLGLPE